MGRELRRKEERKNQYKGGKKKQELDTSIKASTVFKILIFIVLFLFILYYILAVFVTKEIDVSGSKDEATSEDSTTNTNSVSNRILASATFSQKEEEYYVCFYDFTDEEEEVASAINNRSDIKIYRVDTSSSLNQNYVTEESGNRDVTGIENLKVKSPTLLQIAGDQVVQYYEGSSSIVAFLNQQLRILFRYKICFGMEEIRKLM